MQKLHKLRHCRIARLCQLFNNLNSTSW